MHSKSKENCFDKDYVKLIERRNVARQECWGIQTLKLKGYKVARKVVRRLCRSRIQEQTDKELHQIQNRYENNEVRNVY